MTNLSKTILTPIPASLVTIFAISAILFIISTTLITILEYQYQKTTDTNELERFLVKECPELYNNSNKRRTKQRYLFLCKIILYSVILITTVLIATAWHTARTARTHGCTNAQLKETTADCIWRSIDCSPVENTLPEDKTSKIILYYKFGCKDCEAIYQELYLHTKDIPDIYWIATRSEQGINLRKQYPIKNVPSGIAVNHTGNTLTKVLYRKNRNQTTLDTDNLSELIRFQKGGTTWKNQ